MRFSATVVARFAYMESFSASPEDARERFWRSLRAISSADFDGPIDDIITVQENRFRKRFAELLEKRLNSALSAHGFGALPIIVIVKQISYGSIVINFDAVVKSLSDFGFSPDDFISIMQRYCSSAIYDALEVNSDYIVPTHFVGTLQESNQDINKPGHEKDRNTKIDPRQKMEKIWLIANTSSVIPSLILLIAAYVAFQNSTEERAQIRSALIQERTDIANQRERMLDRYRDQARDFQNFMADQARHYGNLNAIEEVNMREKLKSVVNRPEK